MCSVGELEGVERRACAKTITLTASSGAPHLPEPLVLRGRLTPKRCRAFGRALSTLPRAGLARQRFPKVRILLGTESAGSGTPRRCPLSEARVLRSVRDPACKRLKTACPNFQWKASSSATAAAPPAATRSPSRNARLSASRSSPATSSTTRRRGIVASTGGRRVSLLAAGAVRVKREREGGREVWSVPDSRRNERCWPSDGGLESGGLLESADDGGALDRRRRREEVVVCSADEKAASSVVGGWASVECSALGDQGASVLDSAERRDESERTWDCGEPESGEQEVRSLRRTVRRNAAVAVARWVPWRWRGHLLSAKGGVGSEKGRRFDGDARKLCWAPHLRERSTVASLSCDHHEGHGGRVSAGGIQLQHEYRHEGESKACVNERGGGKGTACDEADRGGRSLR